jgi:hypothetical protein
MRHYGPCDPRRTRVDTRRVLRSGGRCRCPTPDRRAGVPGRPDPYPHRDRRHADRSRGGQRPATGQHRKGSVSGRYVGWVGVDVRRVKRSQQRWDDPAAQHDRSARAVVVGLADGDGIHAGPHEGNTAAAVLVIDRWRAPAAVVAHDDSDPALTARYRFDLAANVHHFGELIVTIGVFNRVADGLADCEDDVFLLTWRPARRGEPVPHPIPSHRRRNRVRRQLQAQCLPRRVRPQGVVMTGRWHRDVILAVAAAFRNTRGDGYQDQEGTAWSTVWNSARRSSSPASSMGRITGRV